MAITNREELIDYCLRNLGHPVIDINVSRDQVEDRIDDTFQFFVEYHFDGTIRDYVKHQMTADDVTNEYVAVPDAITSVQRIFPISAVSATGSSGMFNVQYQFALNDFAGMSSIGGSLHYYDQMRSYMSLLDSKLNGVESIRFSRKMGRLYIDVDWGTDIVEGTWIVMDTYRVVDPESFPKVYNDMFVKEYATALIKKQWGSNLIKFEGMSLPGNVTFNGRQIYDDANTEIDRIKQEMSLKYELPVDFYVG